VTSADHQHENTDVTGSATGQADTAGPVAGGEPQETAAPRPGAAPGEAADAQPGEGGDMAGDSPTQLVADLAKSQDDVAALTADLQRLQAEYVNYKRRVDRDRELVKQNATFTVLSSLLPVLDDIDRAREHGEVEGGFKAVADSLERIIAGLGLEKFGKPGDEFDPNLHEALMHAHSPDVTTTTCQNIVHAGYRIGERVVRPARVTVVDPEPGGEPAGDVAGDRTAAGADDGADDGASSTND
jgi:molecular chaperone GrpE